MKKLVVQHNYEGVQAYKISYTPVAYRASTVLAFNTGFIVMSMVLNI